MMTSKSNNYSKYSNVYSNLVKILLLWKLLVKMTNRSLSKLKAKYLMEITRELNKKSPMYFYTIYIKESQFILAINSSILKYTYCL